jgi:energy-coupling factor transport system ATP-binding protein
MQYPEYQLFAETVREDIAFGPKNMGLSEDELEKRVLEAARFSGVEESWLDKSPFELSGGQKRRVALAGVLAMQPKILILDEPAAGLDPVGRRDILGGIKRYSRESGTTVVIVSHSMEDMAMYCDDIVVMANAKVLMHKPCADVFSEYRELIAVGLDVPQITRVASALRDLLFRFPQHRQCGHLRRTESVVSGRHRSVQVRQWRGVHQRPAHRNLG